MTKYIQAETLPEAISALQLHGNDAKLLAGGTAVILMLQKGLITPDYLVSLGGLDKLTYIHSDVDGLHIGAMTNLRDIELSPLVHEKAPLLAKACGEVGNIRVRNQATLGGNLAEADYSSDPPAALLALNASAITTKQKETRQIVMREFFLGFYTTALAHDEIIVEILIPPLSNNYRSVYHKYKSRSSEDRACVGVAAMANIEDNICLDLRLAIGAASETPQRLSSLENLAVGKRLDPKIISEIATGYAEGIECMEDMRGSAWYRTEMIRVLSKRVLEEIANGHR